MPEIVEIRRYADFLRLELKGQKIMNINILKGRYLNHSFENYSNIVKDLPLQIIDIHTKGKFLYFEFERGYFLFTTLGLQGGWCLYDRTHSFFPLNSDYITPKNALNHLNIQFVTENKTAHKSVYYFDILNYGTMKAVTDINEVDKKLSSIGEDILSISVDNFIKRMTAKKNLHKLLGEVMLDQKVVSGYGNYLRADILWLSKVSPFRLVKDLSSDELHLIFTNSKILTWGVYNFSEGVRRKYYTNNTKLPKDYDRLHYIYNQQKDIYGNIVSNKQLLAKRNIHWVPSYQI